MRVLTKQKLWIVEHQSGKITFFGWNDLKHVQKMSLMCFKLPFFPMSQILSSIIPLHFESTSWRKWTRSSYWQPSRCLFIPILLCSIYSILIWLTFFAFFRNFVACFLFSFHCSVCSLFSLFAVFEHPFNLLLVYVRFCLTFVINKYVIVCMFFIFRMQRTKSLN